MRVLGLQISIIENCSFIVSVRVHDYNLFQIDMLLSDVCNIQVIIHRLLSHVSRQHLSLHLRWIRFHIFTLCLDIIKCFSPWHIWVAWIWLVILLAYEFLFYFFEFTITRPILCLCTLLVPANITICYLSKIADKVSWALIVTGNTRVISLKSRKLVMPHSW